MHTILCPTDFSETANNAYYYAADLAKDIGAKLRLVHVLHVPAVDVNASANVLDSLMESQQENADQRMQKCAAEITEKTGVAVEHCSKFGLATDVIVEEAETSNAFLIVMGTNGVTGALDRLLGTVSYGVVKNAQTPTIVVPSNSEYTGFKRIAFADDHKDDLSEQMSFISELGRLHNAQLDLISVEADRDEGEYNEECVVNEGGVKRVCIWAHTVLDGLDKYTSDNAIELLAIKHHQRSFFENLLHKSTTKQVLNNSTIPVLIFN
jgi:nucleotide-binding universal stress UspA family protein